jgi:methyl-accepting chemotaxis protein PixJ
MQRRSPATTSQYSFFLFPFHFFLEKTEFTPMVLDSRSRVDSTEKINGNGANPVSNGSSDGSYTTIDVIPSISIPIAPKPSQNPVGKWWRSLGLQTKTTLVSVVAITIPLFALGGFTYVYVGQNISNATKTAKAIRAEGMANRTAIFMRARYGDIKTIADLPIFTNPKVQAVVTPVDQKAILENYLKSNNIYDSIAFYRLDGTLVLDAGTEPAPANAFKRGYFQEVLKTDKVAIAQPEPSVVTKRVSVFVAAPVKDLITKKTIGIVRTRMPESSLENIYKDYIPAGETYYLVESDAKFFIALEKDRIGRELKAYYPELGTSFERRESGSTTVSDELSKQEVFVGYAPLPMIGDLDLKWEAVISVNAAQELKPLQSLLLILTGATTGIGLLAALLAIAIARRATRPIIEATAGVVELGKGNLDARLAVQGEDEMAQLGGNINLMAGQLQTFLALQETQTRRSQILAEVSRSRDLDELEMPLNKYMAEIRQELNCDRVVVYRFMDDGLGVTRGIIVAEDGLAHLTNAKAAGLSDPCIPRETLEAYKQGRIMAINDVFKEGCLDPAHINLMNRLQIKSNLIVPVIRVGELDSLLIAHSCDRQRNWQESEIATLQQLADEIGRAISGLAALEQQRLLAEQERNRSEAIQRELINLLSDVEGAVSGDLTVRAQISAGEIGIVADFFNAIVESLRDVVTQVKQATLQVNTSVNSNNESIRTLAKDATLQSEQLDGALQSVAEMTDSMQQVALSAQQAADASGQAADTAEVGSAEIEQSVKSILQLRQTVDDTAKKVKRLGEASKQISKVVVLIDQIALKTNMLALNASVEAARAGEEGRGFAVVAAEVGALAAQSATATREIGRLVESIQQETNEVVQAMQASTVQVVEGTNRVEDARKSLNQIMEISRKVNTLFQEISLATTSQVQTSQSVRSLMSDLSTQSQRSSETSRDVAISLQGTADVASQLQSSVETFKV